MANNIATNREWLKYVNPSLIDIYPIQFVNCDRLRKNDAVYIFDEVGSGKTISSGLMALDYLYNHPGKRVLIITTNALVKINGNMGYGQFLKDWYEKLPFQQLGLAGRIDIVNNHYRNLKIENRYGLVIVDEAQLFLSTDSFRYQCLNNLRADKIVFLTATPIKTSKEDLRTYVELASNITGKKISDCWIDEINTMNKNAKEIICSQFNMDYPVTRYFKDTIISINEKGYQKRKAKRTIPQIWEYGINGDSKKEALLRNICERFEENNNNRFVIFTRFVEKEAQDIGEYLRMNGFSLYDNNCNNNIKTYKIVTGNNGDELSNYSRTKNLPTVLILTYQIAEQGVNLPGFNYVVNYHISAFPSALEQRFGRIDRMGKNGSVYDDIYICFLISKDYFYFDTNTWNFYCATATYMRNLISYLPSKNTILSEEIIKRYGEASEFMEKYANRINALLSDEGQIDNIIAYFKDLKNGNTEQICECDKELFEFIYGNSIEFDFSKDENEAKEDFRKAVKSELAEKKANFELNKDISKYIETIKAVGDKIFCLNSEGKIKTIDTVEECGKYISEQDEFIRYASEFNENVKFPIIVSKYQDRINRYFEKAFMNNEFHLLFPFDGYRHIFEDIFKEDMESEPDIKEIIDHCEIIVPGLPIFKLFEAYGEILQNMARKPDGDIYIIYPKDFNPFAAAYREVSIKVRQDDEKFGLTDDFVNKYFMTEDWQDEDFAKRYIIYKDESNITHASNWYKLAYHYTRKETVCCYYIFGNKRAKELKKEVSANEIKIKFGKGNLYTGNFYKRKDTLIRKLATQYDAYEAAIKQWENASNSEPEQPEIIKEYENLEGELIKILESEDNGTIYIESFFHHFIYQNYYLRNNYRKYYEKSMQVDIYDCKADDKDLWTRGIFNEIRDPRYDCEYDCTLDKIAKLPNMFNGRSYFWRNQPE